MQASPHANLRDDGPRWISHPLVLPVSALLVGAIYIATLYPGQNWSGDFALYILHAQNLIEGRSYIDTGYLPIPGSMIVSPQAYPPVYSIVLAPVYAAFGVNLEVMKLVGVVSLCLALLAIARCCRYPLSRTQVLFLFFAVALNPYIWQFTNYVRTDLLFTFLCYSALLLIQRFHEEIDAGNDSAGYRVGAGLLIGLVSYAAYGTRQIGLVLPLTFVTCELLMRRRITIASIACALSFVPLVLAQRAWLEGTAIPPEILNNLRALTAYPGAVPPTHFDFISLQPERILDQVFRYRWALEAYWPMSGHGVADAVRIAVFNVTCLLAFIGYGYSLRNISVLGVFLAGYVAVLLLFDSPATIRYLLPVFPLAVYYAIVGWKVVSGVIGRRRLRIALATLYALSTGTIYALADRSEIRMQMLDGITHPDAVEMFAYVRTHTSADDTLVFEKPRIMALLGERRSAPPPDERVFPPERTDAYYEAIEADYLVEMNLGNWISPLEATSPPTDRFQAVFRNACFVVYRFLPRPPEDYTPPAREGTSAPGDAP